MCYRGLDHGGLEWSDSYHVLAVNFFVGFGMVILQVLVHFLKCPAPGRGVG